MIVSHQHRFIFLRTRKTAGTSVEVALSQFCGPDDIITPISPEDEQHRTELGFRGPQNTGFPLLKYSPRDFGSRIRKRSMKQFYNHMPAEEVRRALGSATWDSYFKFTVERDPYDKAISRYWWSTRSEEPRPSIEDFLLRTQKNQISNWPIYSNDSEILADMIIQYEDLPRSLGDVGARLGLPLRLPERRLKGEHRIDRRHYSEVLTPLARARIESACWR